MQIEDVLVIGAGPAGLAAALQARRHGLRVRVFERTQPGGLLWNANRVENYPGFPNGITGPDLVQIFLAQASAGGVQITPEEVLALTYESGLLNAATPQATYRARAVIIASGTRPRLFSDFQVPETLQERVVYAVAGLNGLMGRQFVIVGSGDAAFDYALNLARQNSVIILNRGERVKCLPLLWKQAQTCKNIDYRPATAIARLEALPAGGMTVECSSPHGPLVLQADYLVGAIGRDPALEFVAAELQHQSSELENRGILHFIGDVKNGSYRQTAIAVGDGIRSGMCVARALKELADESDRLDR